MERESERERERVMVHVKHGKYTYTSCTCIYLPHGYFDGRPLCTARVRWQVKLSLHYLSLQSCWWLVEWL